MGLRELFPKPIQLALAVVLISGAVLAIEQPWKAQSTAPPAPAGLPASELQYDAAPDFKGANGWVNAPPQDLVALRGKVVLVDFWTYSCINCIHTFPHVQGWQARYGPDNFTVIGVHTPEFRFEHEPQNVQDAATRYGLTYPVAIDNDYRVWSAYSNHYWPAEYLIDAYGRVRHTHFGEGGYDETEQAIRDLLTEAGHAPSMAMVEGAQQPTGGARISPELYAAAAEGLDRVAIGNAEGYHPGKVIDYARPGTFPGNKIFLVGPWLNGDQNDTTQDASGAVLVRFVAGGGNVVADGPRGACVQVLLDGKPIPKEFAARDVNQTAAGPCIMLDGPRSYDFYAGPLGEHTVELRVPAGFSLFTFDFAPTGRP